MEETGNVMKRGESETPGGKTSTQTLTQSGAQIGTLKTEPKSDQPPPLMSLAEKNAIYNLSRRRRISVEELENMTKQNFGISLEQMSSKDASSFIRHLQQSA